MLSKSTQKARFESNYWILATLQVENTKLLKKDILDLYFSCGMQSILTALGTGYSYYCECICTGHSQRDLAPGFISGRPGVHICTRSKLSLWWENYRLQQLRQSTIFAESNNLLAFLSIKLLHINLFSQTNYGTLIKLTSCLLV